MKKFSSLLVLFIIGVGAFLFSKQNDTKSLNKWEKHQKFINSHPFSKQLKMSKEERIANAIPPNAYFEQEYLLEMNPKTGRAETEKLYALQKKLNQNTSNKNTPGYDVMDSWEERGPFNVPGRTRAIMYDPNDSEGKRLFAGGVSGGLWKSENIESSSSLWERVGISENLAVSCITSDVNNPQNLFVGTGESYVQGSVNGNGIWRSTDGGITWSHIFGGSTGETYYNGNASLTVNSPASIAGVIEGMQSNGDETVPEPITQDLVLADDGSEHPTWACNEIVNATEMNGKIAVIDRGECYFVDKIMNAQNAGAVAVLMINNVAGLPITMDISSGSSITIPAFMINKTDGDVLKATMSTETVNATFDFDTDNEPAGSLVPGAFHVNDIRTRNNDGVTEIYAAITDSYALGSIMGAGTYGLYKSIDNGDSWTKISLPTTEEGNEFMPNDIEIGADNKIWIGTTESMSYGDGGGKVLSSDDGLTFTEKYSIPGGGKRVELAVSATDPDKLYILAQHKLSSVNVLIFKSEDGLATSPSNMAKPNDVDPGIPANDFTRGQAFYDLMIAVDPTDDDIVYVGGVDAFRSTDGASSWEQLSKWATMSTSAPYVHADQHELIFSPNDPNKGVMATDGGVFFASSFSSAVAGTGGINVRKWYYNTTQFYKGAIGQDVSNTKILGGAQDNGSFLKISAAPGLNVFSEMWGGDGVFCFIDKDDSYMVVSNPGNQFYKLNNSGYYENTLISENSGSFINIAELDDNLDYLFTDATNSTTTRISRASCIGSTSLTYLTNDMFTQSPTTLKVSPFTTASTTLFVGTIGGKLFKISNANSYGTWTEITGDEFFGSISAINFGTNEDEIMVTFHNYGVDSIWFTNDGGVTWNSKEGDFPDIPVKDILMNPLLDNEVIIATDLGVWMTSNFDDAEPNWVQSQNGMQNVKVTSFDLRTADNTVLASTYGRGMFTGQFTSNPAGIESNELAQAISIYPSVSNGSVFVRSKTSFDNTNISIYDIQGKEVYQTSLDINENETPISLHLNTGVYIVNFSHDGLSSSERIVIE